MTDVEVSDDGGSTWTAIDYSDFRIEIPTSDVGIAPTATVQTRARESITASDRLRIVIDGTNRFEGVATSGGTIGRLGGRRLEVDHDAVELFEEEISLDLGTVTAETILNNALSTANAGGDFTLDYGSGTFVVDGGYDVDNRPVKQVFRDMADRTARVWYVDPAGSTIHFRDRGDRGTWKALDAETDKISIEEFDTGDVSTVRNDVTVIGTGDVAVEGTDTNSTSISTYGRRTGNSPYLVEYVTTQAAANELADRLINSDPLAEAKVLVGANVGTVESSLVNYDIDLTDSAKGISETGLTVEKQTIEQGRATLESGQGSGALVAEFNRQKKSDDDKTAPGAVIDSSRLADGSVDSDQLVDTAVIESKLADLAVTLNKVAPDAISETKITDSAVTTPKLNAGAVIAAKIAADTITANEITAGTITALEIAADTLTANEIAAGTITATEISSDTITADQIDTLDIDAEQLSLTAAGFGGVLDIVSSDVGPAGLIQFIPTSNLTFEIGTVANPANQIWTDNLTVPSTTEANIVVPEGGDNSGSIGRDPDVFSDGAFDEMWAYDFFDADTGSALDGGSTLPNLSRSYPDHLTGDGGTGVSINGLSKYLFEVINDLNDERKRQQDRIDDLESRIAALEGGGTDSDTTDGGNA